MPRITVCAALLIFIVSAGRANADFIQWKIADGGNGHYYGLVLASSVDDSYSWTEARDAAANMVFEGSQGYLATVTSAAENDFLYNTFGSQITPDYAILGGAKGDQVWIGLSDQGDFSTWQWDTGEPFSYSNWAPPEPNFPDEEFYGLYWRRDYGSGPLWSWNNAANEPFDLNLTRYDYFVEFSPPFSVPEPATLIPFGIGMMGLAWITWRKRPRAAS